MKWLRNLLDSVGDQFEKRKTLKKFWPIYEAADNILFTPTITTKSAPHIRDSLDMKRVMILVVIAIVPCYIFGILNLGFQTSLAEGVTRTWSQILLFGLKIIAPIILITFIAGAVWEILFAVVRKHEINEGFLVTCALIPLIVPPEIPLWQVFVATSFGIVIGKEIFGGVGMNIFNPALVARAFLFFAYPASISGDRVWISATDGYSGATALAVSTSESAENAVTLLNQFQQFDYSWWNMFWGWIPGSIGETSAAMILIGAIILMYTKIGSWRIMTGSVIGLVLTALLTNLFSPISTNTMLTLPPHYHLVMGGFLFGTVFMATDPVSAAQTNRGRWIYGFMIGFLTVIIRSINPAYPEGTMLAILLMNAFAPLIDYFIVQTNIKKRLARYAQ
ncbi:MAG: NADH:ubiquinone reductase (Na(+)-transporting) subunit B [Candidatus Marinimicrobia bacterium]|nr:NADH:ubiquinone reductase (Na(+)-transporting) subunit B [Candidatus Neomarinimicrobiota bacterium]